MLFLLFAMKGVFAKSCDRGEAVISVASGMSLIWLAVHTSRSLRNGEAQRDVQADDYGRGWKGNTGPDDAIRFRKGLAVLVDDAAVHEAKAVAEVLENAHIRCRCDVLREDRNFYLYGNGGMGTKMCVLVKPDDYSAARTIVADALPWILPTT